jgi:hypothetical protein
VNSPAPRVVARRADSPLPSYNSLMMRKDQIIDEVRRLPAQDRMDVLQGVLELVALPLSTEEEKGLAEAMDEADRGELVDGAEAIAKQRRRVHGAG